MIPGAVDAAQLVPDGGQEVTPPFRMPAEWEPHAGTWVSWPHREASWPGRFEPVPEAFARMVAAIAHHEPVHINIGEGASGQAREFDAVRLLRALNVPPDRTIFYPIVTDDAWCRDHGPIFVEDAAGRQVLLDWEYNAWGGKYGPFDSDNAVPQRVADVLGLPVTPPGMVLEGGSIDVNGRGTLLTTEQCLLNPNRNPGLSRDEIEANLRRYLGVERILWLGEGIVGDDTDGHIDDIARFVDARTVVAAVEEDPVDENYAILQDNLTRLRGMIDQSGQPLEVVELPMPGVVEVEGERVPASYANFYIVNGLVLVPTYNTPNDRKALDVLARCFPDRAVRGLDCTDLIWGLGAIHCLTQQWPQPPPMLPAPRATKS